MLCQNCGKHEATTHIKRVVNGESTQAHLCPECAAQLGYGDVFSDMGFSLSDFFGGFFAQPAKMMGGKAVERCSKCGTSFEEIVKTGKIGCADCYDKFYDLLLPSIQRIHGKTEHNGKVAFESTPEVTKEDTIQRLRDEMAKAVEEQNFEQAAQLRDKIKELEEK